MSEAEDQMGLFEAAGATCAPPPGREPASPPPRREPAPPPPVRPRPAARKSKPVAVAVPVSAPAAKKVSGLVPQGDVRLTANIRQDLHLKLKISSAHRRTTIGEILEELIEKHL